MSTHKQVHPTHPVTLCLSTHTQYNLYTPNHTLSTHKQVHPTHPVTICRLSDSTACTHPKDGQTAVAGDGADGKDVLVFAVPSYGPYMVHIQPVQSENDTEGTRTSH